MTQRHRDSSLSAIAAALGILTCLGPNDSAAALGQFSEPPKNLVADPSFEQPAPTSTVAAPWHGTPRVFSLDSKVARTGKASLKYVNHDAKRYVLCTQRLPVQAGWKCRASAWIKTQNIAGDESGATICLEWQGKDGKWLGGVYPAGIKGTRDWTRVEAITRLPEDAASCSVACYVREGMTGTAWFDEMEVVRVADPPMHSVLLSPVYRGWIDPDSAKEVRLRVRWNLADYDIRPQDLRIRALLTGRRGNVLKEVEGHLKGSREGFLDLKVPLTSVWWGTYDLAVRLERPGGKELQVDHHRLVKWGKRPPSKCLIDEYRRLRVDGKPFFPIGMYWSSITPQDIEVYAQSKFNCLMPYGSPTKEQMDLAQKHGLKVIYSIKDWYAGTAGCPGFIRSEADEEPQVRARVRQFRDHPALLAWYLNDELPQQYLPRLEAHQRWVIEEDRNHPTWVVLYQFREVSAYLNTFDVIGTDPYPIGRKPASMAAEWTAETFRQVERARPMWQVPQLHNWANYAKTDSEKRKGRTPTCDEVRSMAWQCIAEGATGLVFYSWYDVKRNPDVSFDVQWSGLKRLAAEIDRMAPVILSVETTPEVTVDDGGPPAWLHWLVRRHEGSLYLIAVNDGDGQGKVVFNLPATPKRIRELGENRMIEPDGPRLQVSLPRLAVQFYEIELSAD